MMLSFYIEKCVYMLLIVHCHNVWHTLINNTWLRPKVNIKEHKIKWTTCWSILHMKMKQSTIYYQEIILFLTSKHSIMYEEVSFMQNSELLFTKKLTILLLLLWLYREVLLILENNTECLDLTPPFQDRDLQEISRGPPFSNSATNCMNIMYGIMLTVLRTPHFCVCPYSGPWFSTKYKMYVVVPLF